MAARSPVVWLVPVLALGLAIAPGQGVAAAEAPTKQGGTSKGQQQPPAQAAAESAPKKERPKPNKAEPAPPEKPDKAAEPPGCEGNAPVFEHEVVEGEHIGLIAGRYGVRSSDVLRLNPVVKNPDLIRIGQKLRVCPQIAPRKRERIEYEVRSGDNLSEIAQKYQLTVREVIEFQEGELKNPDLIRPGHKIVLWIDGSVVEAFKSPKRKQKHGRLRTGIRLPRGRHYYIKRPHLAFGTAKTIRLIQSAVRRYKGRYGRGPMVHIGDISKRGGGRIPPHLSHKTGRDVDVGYVLKGRDGDRTRFSGVTPRNLDKARTWALIRSFVETNEVVVIFMDYRIQKQLYEYARRRGMSERQLDEIFQYPRGRGRSHGIVRHWRSHRNHFHIRFKR